MARKLSQFDLDSAAFHETRYAGGRWLTEHGGGGYTIFWKSQNRRIHGVGFAIKSKIVIQILEYPVGINEHLMALCLQLTSR